MGSVTLITDRNGHVDEKYQYDVWGKAYQGEFRDGFHGEGHSNNVYGFTGQRYQPELGVYSFPYRDYSPRTMRWMTEDPIRSGKNWYLYCNGDPVNFIDPFGLCEEDNQQRYVAPPQPTIQPGPVLVGEGSYASYVSFAGVVQMPEGIFPTMGTTTVNYGATAEVYMRDNTMYVNVNAGFTSYTTFNPDTGVSETVVVTGNVSVIDNNGTTVSPTNSLAQNMTALTDDTVVYSRNFNVGVETAPFVGFAGNEGYLNRDNNFNNYSVQSNNNQFVTQVPVESPMDTKPDTLTVEVKLNISVYPTGEVVPYRLPDGNQTSGTVIKINTNEPGGVNL